MRRYVAIEFLKTLHQGVQMFQKLKDYTRTEIQQKLGGELQTYLPQKNERILAGCFNVELNPDCPNEIQAGNKPQVKRKAELLLSLSELPEGIQFPVFTKPTMKSKYYRYQGEFRCTGGSNNDDDLARAEEKSGRHGKLSYVLNLESAT
jgi:hypothetical protein